MEWRNADKILFYYDDALNPSMDLELEWDTDIGWVPDDSSVYAYSSARQLLRHERYLWDDYRLNYRGFKIISNSFNEKNLLANRSTQFVNISGEWYLDSEEFFTYTENDNLKTFEVKYYSAETGELLYKEFEEYTWNMNGDPLTSLKMDFSVDEQVYVPYYKSERSYNADGHLTCYDIFYKELNSSDWYLSQRNTKEYNEVGLESLSTSYLRKGDTIVKHSELRQEYDENGRLISKIAYGGTYHSDEGPQTKDIFEYVDDSLIIRHFHYWWNYYTNDTTWTPYNMEEVKFSANMQVEYSMLHRWSEKNSQWIPTDLATLEFDGAGNMVELAQLEKSSTTETWDSVYLELYTYTPGIELDQLIMSETLNDYYEIFTGLCTEYRTFYWDEEVKEGELWVQLYFSADTLVSTRVDKYADLKVYPNPVGEFFYFDNLSSDESVRIEIFNTQGQHLMSVVSQSGMPVPVGNLKAGVYIFRMRMNGSVSSGKFIKE